MAMCITHAVWRHTVKRAENGVKAKISADLSVKEQESSVASKRDEILQQLTAKVVTYMDTPKEVRKQQRGSQKQPKVHWTRHWFGLLPEAFRYFIQSRKK